MSASRASSERVVGLDILRSVAIWLVLLGHSSQHSDPPRLFIYVFGRLGSVGVEIFFALSGFLIGSILIKSLDSGSFDQFRGLGQFWFKRWMRTLPLYYFFLFVWLKLDWRGPFSIVSQWPYFFFGQNLLSPTPPFFEVSWSLAVEEWFYLLFPLAVFVLNRLIGQKRAFLLATTLFLLAPLALRFWTAASLSLGSNFFTLLRVPVVLRLDAIMYGVTIAMLRVWSPPTWHYFVKLFPVAGALFIALIGFYIAVLPNVGLTPFSAAALLTITPIICAGIIPGFYQIKAARPRFVGKFFVGTSILSYSAYLGHIIVIILLNPFLMKHNLYKTYYITYPLYFSGYFLFALATYALVERPFLWIRDLRTSRALQPESPSVSARP